jgi:hypothetical protein
MLELHTSIPLPRRTRDVNSKYPFATLTESGHALIEKDVVDAAKVQNRLAAAVGNYRRKLGEGAPKFAVRTLQIDGKDAVGVWRV